MTGRTIIIIVVGIIITTGTVLFRIEASSTNIVANVGQYYRQQTARNIAQTGVNMGLRRLADLSSWRTGIELMDVLSGKVAVTVLDTTFKGRPVVRISATGYMSYGTSLETGATSTAYVSKGFNPIAVKAVVTTNAQTKIGGGLDIDGRDHDLSGTLIPNNGIFGVWTTSTFTKSGGGLIGGTSSAGIDKAPANPPDTSIALASQTYSGGYPTTPDGVAGGVSNGYPDGALKTVAQSGANGGQYATDPSLLKYPLAGVTYVELAAGSTWSPKLSGAGILIIHNSAGDGRFKQPGGTFTGLIIADDVTNLSGLALIGALVQIKPNPTSEQIGTSNGNLIYSRQAILNATASLQSSNGNGSATNVIAWWE